MIDSDNHNSAPLSGDWGTFKIESSRLWSKCDEYTLVLFLTESFSIYKMVCTNFNWHGIRRWLPDHI